MTETNWLEDEEFNYENNALSLKIMPYEMKIIYIGELSNHKIYKKAMDTGELVNLDKQWQLYLKKSIESDYSPKGTMDLLKNITGHDMYPGFCGSMRYVTELEVDENMEYNYIDFGQVYETAQLWINDQFVGVKMVPPYRFDIAGLLKKGKNVIVLEVTNTLVHQIRDRFSKVMPVEPSGLLGLVLVIKNC